jgi:hypothetical protein
MIVPPKPFYRVKLNNEIKEFLGGYLLNDVEYTDSLILEN